MATVEQYFDAVKSGDAPTMAAFLKQAAQQQACAVNSERPQQHRAGDEWLVPFDTTASRAPYTRQGSLLETAITSGHVEVLEWLFSADAIATVGSQVLATVLPHACMLAMRTDAVAILELLLVSPAYAGLLSSVQQQDLLDRLVQSMTPSTTSDAIELLVAHGACVNPPSNCVLTLSVNAKNPETWDTLIREGTFAVGALAVNAGITWDKTMSRHVLRHRLRPALGTTMPLHDISVRRCAATTRLWLWLGFVDVDARDSQGRTPLMCMSGVDRLSSRRKDCVSVAKLLLEYGASVTATDALGWPLLWFAVMANFPEVVRLVLQHGADPNAATAEGRVPLHVIASRGVDQDRAVLLAHFMECGADPFLPRDDGLTAVDLLQKGDAGRAFVKAHPQWFKGPLSPTSSPP